MRSKVIRRKDVLYLIPLIATFAAAAFVFTVENANAETVDEGTCGENATWMLDDQGVLTISGEGDMHDYGAAREVPWVDSADVITKIVIESGITSVGNCAFNDPDNLYSSLQSVDLPEGLQEIGLRSFRGSPIKEITLPDSLKLIDYEAFAYCTNLESITIPFYTSDIEDQALSGCTSLQEIRLLCPALVGVRDAFTDFTGNIYYPDYPGEDKYWNEETRNAWAPNATWIPVENEIRTVDEGSCGDNVHWELTDRGVLTISGEGEMSEYGYSVNSQPPWNKYRNLIRKVVVEEGITTIGACAFGGWELSINCQYLTGIVLPSTLTAIGENAINGCNNLQYIVYTGTEPIFGNVIQKFYGILYYSENECDWSEREKKEWAPGAIWKDIREIVYDDDGNIIVDDEGIGTKPTEGYCGENATWVLDDQGILTISGEGDMYNYGSGREAPWFDSAGDITKIVIESGITSVGNYAFNDPDNLYSSLQSVDLPEGLKEIGSYSFCGSPIKEITLPDSLRLIDYAAFARCTNLESITIPFHLMDIEYQAFTDCTALQEIRILCPGLSAVEDAFTDFTGNVYYPDYPGDDEYWNEETRNAWAPNATWIPVEDNEIRIVDEGSCGSNAHWELTNRGVLTISGEGGTYNYKASDGKQPPWSGYGFYLIRKVIVEEGITTIGAYAFGGWDIINGCQNLAEISLPSSLTAIGNDAFKECNKLQYVMYKGTAQIFGNVLQNYSGKIYYPANECKWSESKRAEWAPKATWKDIDTIIYDATGDTTIVNDGMGTETTVSEDEVQDVIEEIQVVHPKHVLISAKVEDGTDNVIVSKTQIPASIARVASDAGATFGADTVVGTIELDKAAVEGAVPEEADTIELNITDESDETDALTVVHNVEWKVKEEDTTNSIIDLGGNAKITVSVPPGTLESDTIYSTYLGVPETETIEADSLRAMSDDEQLVTTRTEKTVTTETRKLGFIKSTSDDFANAKIKTANLVYNGKAQPAKIIKVTIGSKVLTSQDYKQAKCINNTKVGTATVTVQGMKKYSGKTKNANFYINPKKAVISKVSVGQKKIIVTMSTKPSATGGTTYKIEYRVAGQGSWKSTTTTSNTRTIQKLQAGKKYQVRVKAYKGARVGAVSAIKTSAKVLNPPKVKKANPMTVTTTTKKVKASKVKKAARTVKAITVSKAKGTVTYSKVSGSKKLTVNKKTGKITVKKKTKKGTYKIKVKVKAAGTANYAAKTKTVQVKIRVK